MYKAFYIQKWNHFGVSQHGFRNRLGLYNRAFDPLLSSVFFDVQQAVNFCDKLAHTVDLRYGPITLSEKDYFIAKCSQIYFGKHGMLPDISDVEALYKVNGNPLNIIVEPTLVTQAALA